jgi:hypothetical protein
MTRRVVGTVGKTCNSDTRIALIEEEWAFASESVLQRPDRAIGFRRYAAEQSSRQRCGLSGQIQIGGAAERFQDSGL